MQHFETGLEHRLKRAMRQMVDQHRHLGPIRAEVTLALGGGERERSRVAYRNYLEAIEAHFQLEGEVFFPALHGLHPEFASDLDALDREHGVLLAKLRALGPRIEGGALADSGPALEHFSAVLGDHERREERLVERIVAAGTPLPFGSGES